LDPVLMLAAVGAPNTTDVAYARQLIQSLPDRLQAAVRDAFSARAVVFAMLLDDDAAIRQRQLELLEERLGVPTREETVRLAPVVAEQGASGRLPLLEIVQSTFRQLSAEQYRQFRATVEELASADRKISLFEFALQRTLLVRLDRHFFKTPPPRVRYPALNGLRAEMSILLSGLAHAGSSDDQQALRAFTQAAEMLGIGPPLELQPRDAFSLREVGEALDKVVESSSVIKKRLLSAALLAISLDGQVTVGEAELLRALGDMLDCPLPPIFAGALQPTAENGMNA